MPAAAIVLGEHLAGLFGMVVGGGKCACFCHVCHGLASVVLPWNLRSIWPAQSPMPFARGKSGSRPQ